MERKLTAILAADVAGYSRLMGTDEEGTLNALRAHREVVDGLVVAHRGRVFGSAGDSIVAEFPSAVEAINCAVEIQQEMDERNEPVATDKRLEFRIGINIGDVMAEGGNLFGDGVNIAARVQELAEPGGICVARNVHDQVHHKVGVAFESLGSHRVKNIAEPVTAYRVLVDGAAQQSRVRHWLHSPQRQRLTIAVLVLLLVISAGGAAAWYLYPRPQAPSGSPSIAVLPFVNMSGDAAQDHFGPGVAEDVITMLSKYPGIRVASRTSSFIYDGPVKVQQVAGDLGVAYVLEGSVKKTQGNRVRVTAQLIDAQTGDHVWADRFDREGDVIVLQEDVANEVYDSLAGIRGEIRKDEERRAWSKSAPSLDEYDYYLRGHQYFFRWTGEDIARAREIFQEGLAKFPDSALLRIKLAATYVNDIVNDRSTDPAGDAARGWKLLEEARTKPNLSQLETWLLHWLSAWLLRLHLGEFERAAAEAEATIRLVPYDPFSHADLAGTMMSAGRPERAVEWLEFAIQRDPRPMPWFYNDLAWALYHANRAEDALASLKKAPEPAVWARAVVYVRLGKMDEARAAVADILKACPDCTIAKEAMWPTGKQPQMVEPYLSAYLDDLRKAGLPEK
jgi:adenylate cyclase